MRSLMTFLVTFMLLLRFEFSKALPVWSGREILLPLRRLPKCRLPLQCLRRRVHPPRASVAGFGRFPAATARRPEVVRSRRDWMRLRRALLRDRPKNVPVWAGAIPAATAYDRDCARSRRGTL